MPSSSNNGCSKKHASWIGLILVGLVPLLGALFTYTWAVERRVGQVEQAIAESRAERKALMDICVRMDKQLDKIERKLP